MFFFFFFKQKTAYEIKECDWSSDVCSSDLGELIAQKIDCEAFDPSKFKNALFKIRELTVQPPDVFQSEIISLCAKTGVAITFVPELPRIRASGATWWMSPHKAVIQLNLRYKRDDQFWFSIFHEAGHILLHGKKDVFIEDDGENSKEDEANKFASEILIPKTQLRKFIELSDFNKTEIRSFASEIGIAPGIVVGRLQYLGKLQYNSHCNDLKRRFEWKNVVT